MTMSEIRPSDGVSSNEETTDDRRWVRLYAPGIGPDVAIEPALPLDAFGVNVAARPDAIALWYFDAALSFRQLGQKVDALVTAWADRVKKGDRVVILNQNTPATVIGVLAVWRLGAIVVPLNPMLTRRELVHYLHDAEPCAAIVGAEQAMALHGAILDWGGSLSVAVSFTNEFLREGDTPALLGKVSENIEMPDGWSHLSTLLDEPGTSSGWSIDRSDIAFLTYTSGTTGEPKAALITHANVASSAEVYRQWLELTSDDVLFAAAPFSHVTGLVAHIAAGLVAGAAVVMCYRFEAATVLDLLARHRCTTTVAAITAYIALLDQPAFDPSRLSHFRKLFSGGAPVAPAIVERWEAATGVYIHNAYGLTETTSPSHLVPLGRRAPVDELTGSLSIGVPVPGTRCRIVDLQSRATVPFGGDVGELMTSGPQVVAGYWRKPDASSAAFEDGWLRTGDIGRADTEGWFYVVDRSKDMIVASGFKVWPREVEDVLLEHPEISEAAVIGVPDSYRGEAPKAFVVLRPSATITQEQLTLFCRERLASYKVPRLIEVLDELPKTNSGKVLRRVLREKSV
jgi:long-chain acyl-CoA synthetase